MKTLIVLGSFSLKEHADVALSNLSELDVKASAVCVIMKDASKLKGFAGNVGYKTDMYDHFRAVLGELRLDQDTISVYEKDVKAGGVLLAINVKNNESNNIKEVLDDHLANRVIIVTA